MRFSSGIFYVSAFVALAFVGPAIAQQVTASGPESIDPASQLQEARAAIVRMQGIEQSISEIYAQVENGDDAAVSQCVYKQLVAVRSIIEISATSVQNIQAALAEGDDARADYELRKIRIMLSKATDKEAQANACFGEGGQGDVQLSFEIDGDQEIIEGIEDGNVDIGSDPPNVTPFE